MKSKSGNQTLLGISVLVFSFFVFFAEVPYAEGAKEYSYTAAPGSKIYFGHVSCVDIKQDGFDPDARGRRLLERQAVPGAEGSPESKGKGLLSW